MINKLNGGRLREVIPPKAINSKVSNIKFLFNLI